MARPRFSVDSDFRNELTTAISRYKNELAQAGKAVSHRRQQDIENLQNIIQDSPLFSLHDEIQYYLSVQLKTGFIIPTGRSRLKNYLSKALSIYTIADLQTKLKNEIDEMSTHVFLSSALEEKLQTQVRFKEKLYQHLTGCTHCRIHYEAYPDNEKLGTELSEQKKLLGQSDRAADNSFMFVDNMTLNCIGEITALKEYLKMGDAFKKTNLVHCAGCKSCLDHFISYSSQDGFHEDDNKTSNRLNPLVRTRSLSGFSINNHFLTRDRSGSKVEKSPTQSPRI